MMSRTSPRERALHDVAARVAAAQNTTVDMAAAAATAAGATKPCLVHFDYPGSCKFADKCHFSHDLADLCRERGYCARFMLHKCEGGCSYTHMPLASVMGGGGGGAAHAPHGGHAGRTTVSPAAGAARTRAKPCFAAFDAGVKCAAPCGYDDEVALWALRNGVCARAMTGACTHASCSFKHDTSALVEYKRERREVKPRKLDVFMFIDVSGSMSGAKIEATKEAALTMLDELDGSDAASLHIFNDSVTQVLPLAKMKDADKGRIRAAVSAVAASGSTALHDALYHSWQQVKLRNDGEKARWDSKGNTGAFNPTRRSAVIILTDGEESGASRHSLDEVKAVLTRPGMQAYATYIIAVGVCGDSELAAFRGCSGLCCATRRSHARCSCVRRGRGQRWCDAAGSRRFVQARARGGGARRQRHRRGVAQGQGQGLRE